MDKVLTVNEVAAMIRVPAATLRYWRHQGAGPESFKWGRDGWCTGSRTC